MRTRLLLLATMLTVATACDKKGAGTPALASRPNVLFQVFGSADDPRVVPLAFIDANGLRPMDLSPAEWREFDSLYTRGGDSLTLYYQGKLVGQGRIQRGMWEGGKPLYTLPGCTLPLPQATVQLAPDIVTGNLVEGIATAVPVKVDTVLANRAFDVGPLEVTRAGREIAAAVGRVEKIPQAALDSLDFRALAANTGATKSPTLVASLVDPAAGGEGGKEAVRHVLVIADRAGDDWIATYRNVVANAGPDTPLRRYVDRLDLNGDGVLEIVLEEWTLRGGARPVVLRWAGDKWEDAWVGRSDWCIQK